MLPLRGVWGVGDPPRERGGRGESPRIVGGRGETKRAKRVAQAREEARRPPCLQELLAFRGRVGGSHLLASRCSLRKCSFPTHPRVFGGDSPPIPLFFWGASPPNPPSQEQINPLKHATIPTHAKRTPLHLRHNPPRRPTSPRRGLQRPRKKYHRQNARQPRNRLHRRRIPRRKPHRYRLLP